MNEYILINRVPISYTTEDAKSVTVKWNALTDQWKSEHIFVTSFVFPSQGFVVSDDGSKTTKETIQSGGLKIVSVIVLKASDYDEVLQKARKCPILQQQGTVEVVETMIRR